MSATAKKPAKTAAAAKLIPLGDRVVFTSYAGEPFKIGDEELLLMREDDILAVLG